MKTGSLFSGIGGIDLGFQQAGFEIAWAIERDAACCKTYRFNFGNTLIENDIKNIDPHKLSDIDVLCAGFPCQPFSVGGKQRGFKDESGNMFFEILRFAEVLSPQIIFLENVKNISEHDNGKTFNVIHNCLSERGYFIRYSIMRASEHCNIPQIRDRIYIAAFKDYSHCEKFRFPEKVNCNTDANSFIDRTEKKHDIYYYNGNDGFSQKAIKTVTSTNAIYRVYHDSIKKTMNGKCPTLTASMGTKQNQVPMVRDDYGVRKLTLRECLDFQGFPKTFRFPNSITVEDAYKQIGNSVCVPIVEKTATEIFNILKQSGE